uniref:Ig-like domain-containing protein n=1 Tax=Cyprinodon variegatus TaxID=28743 RepID=A0A3Q2FST1_CYPVA
QTAALLLFISLKLVLSMKDHINVTILPKPSITIEPAGVITFGELVTITCSISTQLLNGSFTLQRRKPNYRYVYNSNFYDMKSQLSSTNSSIFRFLEVSSNHEGYYRCYYKKAVTIRTLTSPFRVETYGIFFYNEFNHSYHSLVFHAKQLILEIHQGPYDRKGIKVRHRC